MNDQSRTGEQEKAKNWAKNEKAIKSSSLPWKDVFNKEPTSNVTSLSEMWEMKESH